MLGQKVVKNIRNDHFKINACSKGDFSGLTSLLLPMLASDLKSELISETGVESLFRGEVNNQSKDSLKGSIPRVLTNENERTWEEMGQKNRKGD